MKIEKVQKAGGGRVYFNNVIVEITAKGKKFKTELSAPKGSHENPVPEAELLAKFRVNAAYSMLNSSKVEGILQTVNELEKVADVTELFKMVTVT